MTTTPTTRAPSDNTVHDFDQRRSDHRDALHANGVHVDCKPVPSGKTWKLGDGTWRSCPLAGRVERFHGHDYDGPLVCCDEVAP